MALWRLRTIGGIILSKVICEICGTVYPDNATVCPICGYPRSVGESIEELETEAPQSTVRRSERVKGGRFSNKNVKKRKKASESYEPEETPKARRSSQPDAPVSGKKKSKKRKKNSNKGLVITVIVLLVAVLLVGAYIGMRFFVGKDAYRETTVPTETAAATAPTETEPADTAVHCTDIQIGDIDLTQGIEFLGMGRAWRVNVTLVPENTTDSVTYSSADESVAVVNVSDDRVEILSVGPGSTTVTITCGAVTKSFPVVCSFEAETTAATEESSEAIEDTREEGVLALDVEDISFFAVDENYTIDPGLGIDAGDVTWSSDDEDVAVVDETGKVTAVGAGTCQITAEYDGEEDVCIIRCQFGDEEETEATEETEAVEDAGPPYKISHTDVSIRIGETFTLTLKDKNGDIVDVTWVGDEDVEIDGNDITGVGSGRVYVKCTHNGEEFECIVRVG